MVCLWDGDRLTRYLYRGNTFPEVPTPRAKQFFSAQRTLEPTNLWTNELSDQPPFDFGPTNFRNIGWNNINLNCPAA